MAAVASSDDRKSGSGPSGRVRHDSGGRAVWEWAVESGRHAIESTSRLLKRLDLTGISISDYEPKATEKPAAPTFGGQRETDPLTSSRRSFDPYNNRAPTRSSGPPAAKPVAKPRVTQPAAPAARQGLLSRLFSGKRK